MLAQWAAVTDLAAGASLKPKKQVAETNEAREGRLREAYENALSLCNSSNFIEAKDALVSIAEELRQLSTDETVPAKRKSGSSPRPSKRPRKLPEATWVKSLRYVVNRNLGDVFTQLGNCSAALKAYSKALDDDSSDFVVWLRAARTATAIGQLHIARRAYEAALRMRPGHFLCRETYNAVLRAIGDEDDDIPIDTSSGLNEGIDENSVNNITAKLVMSRYINYQSEREEAREADAAVDVVQVRDARWMAVIDAVCKLMEKRLGKQKDASCRPVGAAIKILVGDEEKPLLPPEVPNQEGAAETVPLVTPQVEVKETSPTPTEKPQDPVPAAEPKTAMQVVELSASPAGADTVAVDQSDVEKKTSKAAPSPPPDPRRSLRQRATTDPMKIVTDEPHDEFLDSMLSLVRRAANAKFEEVATSPRPQSSEMAVDKTAEKKPPEAVSVHRASCNTWTKVISEEEESAEVVLFCSALNRENSGPVHILLSVLSLLAGKESSQFSSELAQVWIQLRKFAIIHNPGSAQIGICVIEALLISALKVRRMKKTKLDEASRLLTIVSSNLTNEVGSTSASQDSSRTEFLMLSLRCTWLFCHLNEKTSRVAAAYSYAVSGLDVANEISAAGITVMAKESGPEFADSDTAAVIKLFEKLVVRLKRSSELETASSQLAQSKKGSKLSASKALSILAPSIRESVQQLGLDVWKRSDIGLSGHVSSDVTIKGQESSSLLASREELLARLVVFGEACTKSQDLVGEMLCHAVRLRIAVVSYRDLLDRERVERPKKKQMPPLPGSSASKLSEITHEIRQYVAIVKSITFSPASALSSQTLKQSGWTLTEAVQISCHALITLCELFCRMIPALSSNSAGYAPVPKTQRNLRVALGRCVLAFFRCLQLLMKLSMPLSSDTLESGAITAQLNARVSSSRVLAVCAFCIRILANRGCCREEGTSGALIKLYTKYLSLRLQELVQLDEPKSVKEASGNHNDPECIVIIDSDSDDFSSQSKGAALQDICYDWADIGIVRQQLAQCYYCLFRFPDLESLKFSGSERPALQWLQRGCRATAQLGFTFVSAENPSSTPKLTVDSCRGAYFFYRRLLLDEYSAYNHDGPRPKRGREVLSEIVDVLQGNPSADVPALSLSELDAVVSSAAENKTSLGEACVASVTALRADWSKKISNLKPVLNSKASALVPLQSSIMFFEVYILRVVGIFASFDTEYKKVPRSVRRKLPSEAVERLLSASSDCAVALRCRPWSAGAWILLGRICVELADLALDEREMTMSTFGIFRLDDLSSAEGGQTAESIIARAEVCFELARILAAGSWPEEDVFSQSGLSSSDIYWERNLSRGKLLQCAGDDGDLFGALGLSNETTSRPLFLDENDRQNQHAPQSSSLHAAIQLGKSALCSMRCRENRYWYQHWNVSTLAQSDPDQVSRPLPERVAVDTRMAIASLEEGLRLLFIESQDACNHPKNNAVTDQSQKACKLKKIYWYYLLQRAKLKRKLNHPLPEFLMDFASALHENERVRTESGFSSDIEPLYQLHAARAKILISPTGKHDESILEFLVQHAFNRSLVDFAAQQKLSPRLPSHVEMLRTAIGRDVLAAMQACRAKSEHQGSEQYFKCQYYASLMYREVLGDNEKARQEIETLFRREAATKLVDPNSDSCHRGYFYRIWNTRYTDTGLELAIETERKLVRWRFKVLGLLGRLLREAGDRRFLAGIILRLKRRAGEDLPVDGAVLDDLILAYADITRVKILSSSPALTSAADCDTSFSQTWQVFVESLRLVHGVRRVRIFLQKGESCGVQPSRLMESSRPWCQVAIANALHLERLRWLAIAQNKPFDAHEASKLQFEGLPEGCPDDVLSRYALTMEECGQRWKVDEKVYKLLKRRISAYRNMHQVERNGHWRRIQGHDNSSLQGTPARHLPQR